VRIHSEDTVPARATSRPADAPVKTIMSPDPATVGPEETLRSVAEELLAGDIGAVLVTAPGGPTGLVSERDIIAVVATGGDVETEQAADVMTTDLVTVHPEHTIGDVAVLMQEAGVRHLPVVDGDRWVGLVSIRDILDALLGRPVGRR
jgi:CBS domain-containing protein